MGDLRYIANFNSSAGTRYRVAIWDEQFSGSAEEFCLGPEGFELTYEGSTDDPWKPFVPSRFEFVFNVEDQNAEDFIIDCATGEQNRFRVLTTYSTSLGDGSNALYWQGYIQGEGIAIQDDYYPYEVRLSASDISFFADLDYASGGDPITGEISVKDTLLNCLRIAGHTDFYEDGVHAQEEILNSYTDWRSASMASGGDPMALTVIDQNTWNGWNSQNQRTYSNLQEVVESCAAIFNARFYQSAGRFWFDQIDQKIEATRVGYAYNVDGTQAATISDNTIADIDRIDLFKNRGVTSFTPGIKYAQREYAYRRNYLEGITADQGNPASVDLGKLPLLTYLISSQQQRFTLKFNITYRIKKWNGVPARPPFNLIEAQPKDGFYNFVPLWRMTFKMDGDTDGYTWHYSQAAAERTFPGIELATESLYLQMIGSKREWVNRYVLPGWARADLLPAELLPFEIIDEEDYPINASDYFNDIYEPTDRTVTVELTLPPAGATSQDYSDWRFELDIHDVYWRFGKVWTRSYMIATLDDIEWKVDSFELIVHGNNLEETPETGRKYRATSPDNYRANRELPKCSLTAFDKRSWHSLRVWTGSQFIDGQLWYRGDDSGNLQNLNYLSVREVAAMNRRGVRLYNCQLIYLSEIAPAYSDVFQKGSDKFIPLQGTFVASMDEWRNLSLFELTRDAAGLELSEVKSEGVPSRPALPGGNFSFSGSGGTSSLSLPQYEFASGITASAYELQEIDLSFASAFEASGVNQVLQVYQDATKLNYPMGYTIDFGSNEIIPTYEFENSVLEIYYWG